MFQRIINILFDATPHSLKNLDASLIMKTTKEKGVEVPSIACSTLRVKGHAGTLGWGLKQMTSKSIIHTNLHKSNNKLVNG
jgi:hypothetical protein